MNDEFWTDFYKDHQFDAPSPFAKLVAPNIQGDLVDLGCGSGRDLYHFVREGIQAYGVDASNENVMIVKQDVLSFMNENKSPQNVYTRFFWHAIPRETQLAILDWTEHQILIEARTTKDKPENLFGKHKRWLVNVDKLKEDLRKRGFQASYIEEGNRLSPFNEEDPHLIRIIAHRS